MDKANLKEKLDKIKIYIIDNFLLMHLVICCIGFIGIITTQIFLLVSVNDVNIFYPYKLYLFPEKKKELISYLVTVPLLFGIFVAFVFIKLNLFKIKETFNNYSGKLIFIILFFDTVGNFLLSLKLGRGITYTIVVFIIWFIIISCPFIMKIIKTSTFKIKKTSTFKIKKTYNFIFIAVIFLFSILNLYYLFKPFVFNRLFIYDEMPLIPAQTWLNINNKKVLVDNITYKEQHNIAGHRSLYDIRTPQKNLTNINCTKVNDSDKMKAELNSIMDEELSSESNFNNYFYAVHDKVCAIDTFSPEYINFLKTNISPLYSDDLNKLIKNNEILLKFYPKFLGENITTQNENIDNFKKWNNNRETWNKTERWFNHQNHILAPISMLNLNRPINEIFMQYGYGTTVLLQKTMNLYHGFNLGDYYKILNSFYYIYYIVFLLVLFLLFKNATTVLCIWGLTLMALNKFLFFHYYIAPGANPLRHFFDIFVIAFLYLYLKHKYIILLPIIDFCCMAGIFLYPEYGLFLSLALIVMFLIKQISGKTKIEIVNSVLLFFVILFEYKMCTNGLNFGLENFFNGISGFLITKYKLLGIYGLIGFVYYYIVKNIRSIDVFKNLSVFMVFYVQGLFLYYLTISERSHLLVFMPIFILFAFIILTFICRSYGINIEKISCVKNIKLFALIIIFIALITTLINQYIQKVQFFNEVKRHPLYEWKIPNSNFYSTMNPVYFIDSIKLLKTSTYSNDNKIYLISLYDNFLPLFADKYNAFKYIELQAYLTSPKILNNTMNQLLEEKPRYIFVDKILTNNSLEAVIEKDNFSPSLNLYYRAKLLQYLFVSVRDDYEPVESSYLLTVYKRKAKQ